MKKTFLILLLAGATPVLCQCQRDGVLVKPPDPNAPAYLLPRVPAVGEDITHEAQTIYDNFLWRHMHLGSISEDTAVKVLSAKVTAVKIDKIQERAGFVYEGQATVTLPGVQPCNVYFVEFASGGYDASANTLTTYWNCFQPMTQCSSIVQNTWMEDVNTPPDKLMAGMTVANMLRGQLSLFSLITDFSSHGRPEQIPEWQRDNKFAWDHRSEIDQTATMY